MKISSFIFTAILVVVNLLVAGEAAPDKKVAAPPAKGPFPEFPEVLFFEGFERATTFADKGKIVDDPAEPPKPGHVWKLESNDKEGFMQVHLEKASLKIPGTLNPANIYIQASVYADIGGTITVKVLQTKGELTHMFPVPKPKTWSQVTVKLSDLKNKETKLETDQIVKELEFHIGPHAKAKVVPKMWIDNIIVTLNTNPVDILPRILIAEQKRIDMDKKLETDGFTFTMALNDFLKNAMKPFKKVIRFKRALVIGPNAEQTPVLKDQLKAAALLSKETAFAFDMAEEPGASDKTVGGLDATRTLLMYNLQKNPEFVVLSISPEEALGPGRPTEIIRVAALRALESGTVPIVCLPSPSKLEEKEKVAAFTKTMEGLCAQWGVPIVDGGKATKNEKGEFDPAKVGPKASESTMHLAMKLMTLIHEKMNEK